MNAKHSWIWREKHTKFECQREQYRPGPMPSRSAADDSQIHHAKRRTVAEVVNPSDNVRGERILGLLDGLSEHHRPEAREDLEQLHRRHD